MDVKYVAIHHRELATYILVPKQWPNRANSLLLTLAEQIIAQFNEVSPVVRMCDIPTRLICRVDDIPDSKEDIEIEIFSGQYLNRISWSGDGMRAIPSPHQVVVTCCKVESNKRGGEMIFKSRKQKDICDVCGRFIGEKSR
ncbi:hypothetical protein KQX54_010475 [Cotesia glomerata]|uniref:Uncharacterized protein n=1 Tax=Cotesia glomerata TaxID=32391 RepID=A0AAV7IMR1_COTGL|nr:hypothetical protein KQX54_010475 [Cotesia glomerata]